MTTEGYVHACLENWSGPVLQHFIHISLQDRLKKSKLESILSYLLKNPNSTVPDFKAANLKEFDDVSYESTHRYFREKLIDLDLIEITRADLIPNTKTKFKKYYRLSFNGLFYVLMNSPNSTPEDIIQSVVTHYRNNVLFGIFLYPYIREDTLMKLTSAGDIKILPYLHTYLRNTCRNIHEFLRKLETSKHTTTDEYLSQQIFFWNKDTTEPLPWICILFLKHFLEKTLKWDWLNDANFIPDIRERTIEIRNPYNPKDNSAIRILEDGKIAILRQNSKRMFEFLVSETDKRFSFEVKSSRKRIDLIKDSIDISFVHTSKEQLLVLLTRIRYQVFPSSDTYHILHQDERFKKALQRMKLKPLNEPDF